MTEEVEEVIGWLCASDIKSEYEATNKEIILNLIEKQSKEIENQKEKRENQKQELAILNEKQKEFNKLKNTVKSYEGQFKRQQKEIAELKSDNYELNNRINDLLDSIPKQKIRDKINELEKEYNQFVEWDREDDCFITREIIEILEELLEEE